MTSIEELLKRKDISTADLLSCFERVKEDGNVAVIKLDGERESKQYTVFITFPNDADRQMIRSDEDSLHPALIAVLKSYVEFP